MMNVPAKSTAGGVPIKIGAAPMNDVHEILSTLAAIASIGRFLLLLWQAYKRIMDDEGRQNGARR